jgi:hypothetical protein
MVIPPILRDTARPVDRDDLRRIAVYIDEHAKEIGLVGKCDPRLQHVPARPHRIRQFGCGEDAAHGVFLNTATVDLERRVAPEEIIVYRLGHPYRSTAGNRARGHFGFIASRAMPALPSAPPARQDGALIGSNAL